MTPELIYTFIERNKCCLVQVNDFAGHLIHEVTAGTPQQAVSDLKEIVPELKSYKRLQIKAVEKKSTPWSRGFCWSLEFEKAEGVVAAVAGLVPAGQISPMQYVDTVVGMMKENSTLQLAMMEKVNTAHTKLLEKEIEMRNADPMRYMPMISMLGPAFGLKLGTPVGIAGPGASAAAVEPKKNLHFADGEDLSKKSSDELLAMTGQKFNSVVDKITPIEMYQFASVLDKNPNLKEQIGKITKLLQGIIDKPYLLDQAMAFV